MKPFITSSSGSGQYFVTVKVGSIQELHDAHDIVLAAFRTTTAEAQSGVGEWVLVPRDATADMTTDAVRHALSVSIGSEYPWPQYMADLYKIMLAASPPIPDAPAVHSEVTALAWGVLDMQGDCLHSVHFFQDAAEKAAFGLGRAVPLGISSNAHANMGLEHIGWAVQDSDGSWGIEAGKAMPTGTRLTLLKPVYIHKEAGESTALSAAQLQPAGVGDPVTKMAWTAVQSAAEWDDRTSPDGYEDYLFFKPDELHQILVSFFETVTLTASPHPQAVAPEAAPQAVGVRGILIDALNQIRDLNMSGVDENGHKWSNSDLIDQEVIGALSALQSLSTLEPQQEQPVAVSDDMVERALDALEDGARRVCLAPLRKPYHQDDFKFMRKALSAALQQEGQP